VNADDSQRPLASTAPSHAERLFPTLTSATWHASRRAGVDAAHYPAATAMMGREDAFSGQRRALSRAHCEATCAIAIDGFGAIVQSLT